ncbi:hypothetical protein DM47_2942 [Burkholderia mallei]|nr:hypothetical protein DM75_3889 [Burkholderia mallei]KGD24767.1 hypothetical protein DP42_5364 [Burkholderia pseudomallei]KGW68162.1 hypothetical protein Y042_5821 [Burkholderia pseudomallei MSHR1357]KOS74109.1 hypothetical protein DM46_2256 [Burkholderia mallei]KOS93727.1 hypothetical protein DM45_3469 [Burkholderia mallei]
MRRTLVSTYGWMDGPDREAAAALILPKRRSGPRG